jgi:DNA replication initiation complex subunit (GINS family)
MYAELLAAWLKEIEGPELGSLPSDFYKQTADYLKQIKEETRMLDKKTVKANLLEQELQNVKRMLQELILARYEKLMKLVAEGQKAPTDALTTEETQVATEILPFADSYKRFVTALLQGQLSPINGAKPQKSVPLRFIKEVPAIIGADMKTYGPFMIEDIASVPIENAKILVRQGLAAIVQVT